MQGTAVVSIVALMLICLWAARAWPPARPWAIAILLWAANSTAFYIWYLILRGGVIDETVVFWSGLIRAQGYILAGGGLIIVVVKGRRNG